MKNRTVLALLIAVALLHHSSGSQAQKGIQEESPVVDFDPDADTPELFRSIQSLSLQDQLVAEGAAQSTAQSYSPDTFIRWNPILITDKRMFFDEVEDGDEITYIPRKTVILSPFPGTTFVAENRRFRTDSLGFSWRGEIVSGGTGRVSIKLLNVGHGVHHVVVSILSDGGAFRVQRTKKTPYYVALEQNPHRQVDFM